MEQFQISAKNLGAMAMPNFCERCFWIKLHAKKLPWQIFPGIFSTIDAYTKKVVRKWIDRYIDNDGSVPSFMADYEVTGYIEKVPYWKKFRIETKHGITLSGAADDIWTAKNGFVIPDYKTAKFTANADKLLPMYKVQLNGYAMIAEATGFSPVVAIPLIYMVPQTDDPWPEVAAKDSRYFEMSFLPHALPLEMDIGSVDPLLERARKIYDGPVPDGAAGCKDCEALSEIQFFGGRKNA